MNWQKQALSVIIVSVFIACSNNSTDDPASSTQAANTNTPVPSTETVKSEAKEKRSDAAAQRIKGKVQSMTETTYPGQQTKTYSLKNMFKYDETGNRLELINYKPDGSMNSIVKSSYDSAGKIAAEETILADGTIETKSTIKTDVNGNRVEQQDIKQKSKNQALFNHKHIFRYDAQAHLIERVAYAGNGGFFFKYTFAYDVNGNRTEWLQLTETNIILGKVEYTYDDKNNVIEEKKYKGDGTLSEASTFTYEFDKKSNWTRRKRIQNGTVVEVTERIYKYY